MKIFDRFQTLFFEPTLTRRLLLWIIPVALLGIGVLGTSSYLIAKRHILNNVAKEIETLGNQTALTLSDFFKQRLNDLESVSESPLLADYYNNRYFGLTHEAESYRIELEKYFLRLSKRVGIYDQILFIDEKGREICKIENSDIVEKREPFKETETVEQIRKSGISAHYQTPLKFSGESVSAIRYGKPLFDAYGTFRGAILLDCNLSLVQKILDGISIGHSGWAYLTDHHGNFLMGNLPPNKVKTSDLLTSHASIPGTNWNVYVGAYLYDFMKPVERIKQLTLTLGLFCWLLVTLFIYARVRALTNPIQKLVGAARLLEKGDLSGRVEVSSHDEIGTLSKAFNTMAKSLEERTNDLESRIQQLSSLRDVESMIIQYRDEEAVLKNCLKTIAKGLSFERVALYWVDEQGHRIIGKYLYGTEEMGFRESSFQERSLSLGGKDILNEVIRTRKTVLIKNPSRDHRLNLEFIKETKTKEFIAAPVFGKERVFGVITADNYYSKRPLKETDKDGLTLFSNAIGLMLENNMLFQNLKESETRYRTVLESSPVAIIGLSKEHRITTWNRGAESIFGYQTDEIIRKPVTALLPFGSDDAFEHLLAEMMNKGAVREYPLLGKTKTGKTIDISVSWGGAYPDFWMNKEWSIVIRDVSEAKKLQQQIIHSEKLSAVGLLISSIAHELNNPLQAVVGYSELLAEKCELPNLKEEIRMIVANALRCHKIINTLLLFVRHGETKKTPISIRDAVNNSLELLSYKLKKNNRIQIDCLLPSDMSPVIADFHQIQQVFVNLINNACDAMTGWDGPKKLTIQSSITIDDKIRVEIIDSGPGISKDAQQNIFEPFFTTKSEGKGTGLGLSISKQIICDHGGTMGFQSQVNHGTTFWIELPVDKNTQKFSLAEEPNIPNTPGKSILLVEDEQDILIFLNKVLQEDGAHTETASNCKEAVSKIHNTRFDLIIADIQLGDGNGIDLYDHWHQWSDQIRPQFLFLTGDVLNTSIEQTVKSREVNLLKKPINLRFFKNAVRSLLMEKSKK